MSVPTDRSLDFEDDFDHATAALDTGKAACFTSVVPDSAAGFADFTDFTAGSVGATCAFPSRDTLGDTASLARCVSRFAGDRVLPLVTPGTIDPSHPDFASVTALGKVPLGLFIDRLATLVHEPASVLAGLLLLRKFYDRNPSAPFSTVCAHRIVLVAVVLGSKWVEDVPRSNAFWARQLAGVFTLDDVNAMEVEFLHGLGADIRVDDDEVAAMIRQAVSA